MAKVGLNLPKSRELCRGNPEEVQDVGLQGNRYTYGIKSEGVAGHDFRNCGCYFIQEDGGFVDVLDEHETGYVF
jgi:hypothetical protein